MRFRALVVAMWLITLGLTAIIVPWADGEFRRDYRWRDAFDGSRPMWLYQFEYPYQCLQHDWTWLCLVMTAGSAILVLDPREWRRRMEPGTIIVLIAWLVSAGTVAKHILESGRMVPDDSFGLRYSLEDRVPGAILGAWVVTFGRKVGWRGFLITGVWMAGVVLKIAHKAVFG